MKEQNIDSLIDELLGGAKEETPVETPVVSKTPELQTQNISEPQPPVDRVEEKSKKGHTFGIIVGVVIIVLVVGGLIFLENYTHFQTNVEEEIYDTCDAWEAYYAEEEEDLTFESPDLIFFELHGPVKRMIERYENNNSHTYEFDLRGNLVRLDGYDPFSVDVYSNDEEDYTRFDRDNNGRIVEKSGWEWYTAYTWKAGYPSEASWGNEIEQGSFTIEYDKYGFRSGYYHIDTDEYGNWTYKENYGGEITRRTIDYYPTLRE